MAQQICEKPFSDPGPPCDGVPSAPDRLPTFNQAPASLRLAAANRNRSTRRLLLLIELAVVATLLSIMAWPAFTGAVPVFDDLGAFHLPLRAFYSQALQQAQPFDWMPGLYGGFYLTGEGQLGGYHPVHQLLYRHLSLETAFAWEVVISYPLLLCGMYFFLRRHLPAAAALFGGALFTFSSFNLLHVVHPNAVAVVAHIPWLLCTVDAAITAQSNRRRAQSCLAIAVLTGSQLLLGYPQYVWFSLLAETAYALFVFRYRRDSIPRWTWLAGGKSLGLALGMVQLLPTFDALAASTRAAANAGFAASGSLHPLNLLQLVAPYLFAGRVVGENTHELSCYLGAVPLAMFVWWLARATRRAMPLRDPQNDAAPADSTDELCAIKSLADDTRHRDRLAWWATGCGLAALLMSFGIYAPLYRLQTWLPVVGHFRMPCRWIVLVQLAASIVAAVALAELVERSRWGEKKKPARGQLPWVVALGGLVAVILAKLTWPEHTASLSMAMLGPLALAIATAAVIAAVRGSRLALVSLVVLTGVDLGAYGLSFPAWRETSTLGAFVEATTVPPGPANGRVATELSRSDDETPRQGNRLLLTGAQRIDGYAGLEPRRRLDYRNLPALQVAGVAWVRRTPHTEGISGLDPVTDEWLAVPVPLPRARLCATTRVSHSPSVDLQHIDVRTTALVEEALDLPAGGGDGHVSLVRDIPGRIELRVHAPQRRLLVVAESFHDGWQTYIDGKPALTQRVNADFLGCVVDAGRHRVEFVFAPSSLRIGKFVSLVALGITLAGLAAVCLGCIERKAT